jgi:hypothetical protein
MDKSDSLSIHGILMLILYFHVENEWVKLSLLLIASMSITLSLLMDGLAWYEKHVMSRT